MIRIGSPGTDHVRIEYDVTVLWQRRYPDEPNDWTIDGLLIKGDGLAIAPTRSKFDSIRRMGKGRSGRPCVEPTARLRSARRAEPRPDRTRQTATAIWAASTCARLDIMMSAAGSTMMRTTLTLDEDVAAKLKTAACRSGRPFRDVVNEFLRIGLAQRDRSPRDQFSVVARDLGELRLGFRSAWPI